jgi:NAD(P)H-hydrate epimerase
VVTAEQAAARDAAAIASGIRSRDLMHRAGAGAAEVIRRRFPDELGAGVAIYAGPGNNGGDAWVVAGVLAGNGVPVRVHQVGEPRSDDARASRDAARAAVLAEAPTGAERVVVDGLLGTGARGEPAGEIGDAVDRINAARARGAAVIALDVPTGVDATSGAAGRAVVADVTVTFGTIKRGHLIARGRCGAIVVVDIGLGRHAELDDGAPGLIDAAWIGAHVPRIPAEAHKGVRRRVAIVGGARGMAGATILAAKAAMRSGVGMVRLVVDAPSLAAVQSGAIEATAATWPMSDDDLRREIVEYADAVLIGPGLGRSDGARDFLHRLLATWRGPVVLDADALTVFAGDRTRLADLLAGRPALLTPHLGEMARLLGTTPEEVRREQFDVGRALAQQAGAAVLLKGVPTVVTAPDERCMVSASGTPVLAAAGSGDVLGGIAVTLLAQAGDPFVAGGVAAWVHGRAAEIANAGRPVRGVALEDVLAGLSLAWRIPAPPESAGVLAELPRVGEAS